jgi:hypothetical protein
MRVSLSVFEGSSAFFGKDGYVVRPSCFYSKHIFICEPLYFLREAEVAEEATAVLSLPSWSVWDIR